MAIKRLYFIITGGIKNLKSKEEVDREQHNQLEQEESESPSEQSKFEDG